MRLAPTLAAFVLALAACGDDAGRDVAADSDVAVDSAEDIAVDSAGDIAVDSAGDVAVDSTEDVAVDTEDVAVDSADTAPEVVEGPPNISVALDCGAAPPTGPGNAEKLERHAIDLDVFPDALCNDGSNAVLYFRPYVGEENKDRWLINLNGGGGCGSGQSCANRWCWCQSTEGANGCAFAGDATTNFSMANMNGDERRSIDDGGIFLRGDDARPNPMGDWNQVRIVYCSSDAWSGTRRDVPLEAVHPKTGEPVSYSIHFLGSKILDAAIATLRRAGVPALTYSFGDGGTLPDLDDATAVVFSGDSAGANGVITNLDRLRDELAAHNSHCSGSGCPLVVRGLIDAIVGPELSRLDFSTTAMFDRGITSYELLTQYLASVPDAHAGAVYDASCVAWHQQRAPGSEHICSDSQHVIRNHVTTPFFVRMALLDVLISGNYIQTGYSDPDLGPMTLQVFAQVLQRELAAFSDLPADAEEGDAMAVAPGVFAPACPQHDTIHDSGEVYGTSIKPPDGVALTLFAVVANWTFGRDKSVITTRQPDRSDTHCGP